jgi:hypothetical protein
LEPSPLNRLASEFQQLQTLYVIIGGLATAAYSPGRLTEDIDILVSTTTAPQVRTELEGLGATWVGPLSIGGATYQLPSGLMLDVVESSAPWLAAALRSSHQTPSGFPVIALPYLVVLKLDAGRERDLTDIAQMLGQAPEPQLAIVRQVVTKYLPEQATDLESLIQLGQLEAKVKPPSVSNPPANDPPAPEKHQRSSHSGRDR